MSRAHRVSAIAGPIATLLSVAVAAQSPTLPDVDVSRLEPESPLQALPHVPGLDTASMDRTVNPCEDFYRYACGGWQRSNPIPPDQAEWGVYDKLYEDNQRVLWGILDSLSEERPGRSGNQQKIGDYFAACMDEASIERLGIAPLRPILDHIETLNSTQELPSLLADLQRELGDSGTFFRFGPSQDFADSSQIIAFADAGGLGLPDRDYYTETDHRSVAIRAQYRLHLIRVFRLLGEGPSEAARDAEVVLSIESRLARASLTRVDRRDPHNLFHRMSPAELQRLTPAFEWSAYLGPLGLGQISKLNVGEPRFYAALNRTLRKSSLADLKAYLRWHVAHSAAPYLSSAFETERFAFFDRTLRGIAAQKPLWKRCVAQVDGLLGEALGQEYVARVFGPPLKDATLRMTLQIEQAMRSDIETLSWMSDETRHHALVKLDAIINKIGYPDRWRDYSTVEIRRDDHFGNMLRASIFESRRQLDKIGKPLDRSEWFMTPQTVNAYFDQQMNDINFPAGVLQPPLYDPAMDDAPNYGDTGGTIGHELTHAFDDEGRQFDAKGTLTDWWSIADAQRFKQRAQCIVDQYSQYVVIDDVHINSRLTLGEDVADLGGLILAHMAWKAQTAGSTPESRDGLSPEQRFFVGYAQWACENVRPAAQRLQARTDPHSPGRYRVNGLVVNMPQFEQAFMCKAGQPMVSSRRCRVW